MLQIWNSYLKEYKRYARDSKRDRLTVRLLYASQRSFWAYKPAHFCIGGHNLSLSPPCSLQSGHTPLIFFTTWSYPPCEFYNMDITPPRHPSLYSSLSLGGFSALPKSRSTKTRDGHNVRDAIVTGCHVF